MELFPVCTKMKWNPAFGPRVTQASLEMSGAVSK